MVTLGIEKVIWLPGVKGADITDGHTDFYARFAKPGVAVVHVDMDEQSPEYALTKRHLRILESASDAQGNKLEVVTIEAPQVIRPKFESEDFLSYLQNVLGENGILLFNRLYRTEKDKKDTNRFYNNFLKIFPKGGYIDVGGNWMITNQPDLFQT